MPGRYDRMGALLSFGQDPRWRRAMVAAIDPRPGQRVLDVATGTGLVAFELARRGACEVVGLDQSEQMLARARARLAGRPVAGRPDHASCAARPSACRSPTVSSTR